MKGFKYIAYAISALFAMATLYSGYQTLDYLAMTSVAEGVVVSTPIGPHHPNLVFTDSAGNRIEFTGMGDISLSVGDHARIRYRRENPWHTARVDSFGSIWTTTLFLLAMTVVFAVAGIRNLMPNGWGGGNDQS